MADTIECDICGVVGPAQRHPCRFELACRCWYGEPCKGRKGPRAKS